jgi:hypothetical protein
MGVHGHPGRTPAGEPMELRHHERVAGSDRRERLVKAGGLAVRAGQAVVEVDAVLVTPQLVQSLAWGGEFLSVEQRV